MLDFQDQAAYNRDGKPIFDSAKEGLVTVSYRADDTGVYMDSLMADFGKIPCLKKYPIFRIRLTCKGFILSAIYRWKRINPENIHQT